MRKEFRAIVHGRVQQVMYRDFATRIARRLHITGSARNLPDKTVEVIAQGEAASLHIYLTKLHRGSLLAKVEHVDVVWREPTKTFDTFAILY